MKLRRGFQLIWLAAISLTLTLYPYQAQAGSSGATTITETVTTSVTLPSVSGLNLVLSLNSTSILPGQGISVTVDEENTLPVVNNVSASHDWPLQALIPACATGNYPVGWAVFQGYYSASDASKAQPLLLYVPMALCPLVYGDIVAYAFQPSNDTATIILPCQGQDCIPGGTDRMYSTLYANGYYTLVDAALGIVGGTIFHSFSPGVYTAVSGDEWGTLAILHFLVTPPIPEFPVQGVGLIAAVVLAVLATVLLTRRTKRTR